MKLHKFLDFLKRLDLFSSLRLASHVEMSDSPSFPLSIQSVVAIQPSQGCLLSRFPREITYQVLSFLDSKSLCEFSKCCRFYWKLSQDDILWRNLCHWEWKSKIQNIEYNLHPFADYIHLLNTLTEHDVIRLLKDRYEFGLINEMPHFESFSRTELTAFLTQTTPFWLIPLSIDSRSFNSAWKLTYALSVEDAKRSFILRSELTKPVFDFSFQNITFDILPEELQLVSAFDPDGRYQSNLFESATLDWRFIGDGEEPGWTPPNENWIDDVDNSVFEKLYDTKPEILCHHVSLRSRSIQVSEYPYLLVERNPENWAFKLTNFYGKYGSSLIV
ncbi:hypothetical protein BKA69DRAFT_1045423 [Paraphysoderma sedebokerense]|nr:hypothetical protein BKA69DRAFT_1045423 [Paraphysoderma sedebokerense]